MFTKHFLKTLVMFGGIIVIGLIGVLLVNHFDEKNQGTSSIDSKTQVAK